MGTRLLNRSPIQEIRPPSLTRTPLGQTVLTSATTYPKSISTPDVYTYADAQGNPQTYTVYYSSFHLKTNYGCNDYDFTDQLFPTSIVESPTGQQYTITYEPTPGYPGDVTSRVQQITFPSGGFIKYTYSGGTKRI